VFYLSRCTFDIKH